MGDRELECGCRPEWVAYIQRLAARAGEDWEHLEGHGSVTTVFGAVVDEDDTRAAWPLCDPCFGAAGPYEARWLDRDSGMARCGACLAYALEHHGTGRPPSERPGSGTWAGTLEAGRGRR